MKNNNYTIVGIDPGTTSGLAVLDLNENVEKLESGKNFSPQELINSIIETGNPILIATDKGKLPSGVEEISSNFNAKTFIPEEDLSLGKKKELTKGYSFDNPHERDALACALYAHNNYQNMFRNIEARTEELNLPDLAPQIKELVVTEEAENISEAIELLLGESEEEKAQEKAPPEEKLSKEDLKEKIDSYRRNILKERKDKEKLQKHAEKLEEKIKKLESEKEQLEKVKNKLEEGRRDVIIREEEIEDRERKLQSKENEIRKLRREKEEKQERTRTLETFEELRKEGKIPLRTVENLREEDLRRSDRELSLKNSIVLVENYQTEPEGVLDLLEGLEVKALVGNFSKDFEDRLVSKGIWALAKEKTYLQDREGIKYVEAKDLEEAKKTDRGSFLDWLKRYRERKS